jgi:flagellar basal body-associated protein FliL
VISARSTKETLVPPVLVFTPDGVSNKKMSGGLTFLLLILIVALLTAVVFAFRIYSNKKKAAARAKAARQMSQRPAGNSRRK